MNLELSEKERKLLLVLLEDHLHYGWVEQDDEFQLVSSGEYSPTLEQLYRRLKEGPETDK